MRVDPVTASSRRGRRRPPWSGWGGAGTAIARAGRTLARAGGVLLLAGAAAATPASRLQQGTPAWFPAGALVDAAIQGQVGARVVEADAAPAALGLRPGDVIVAVDGQRLDAGEAPVRLTASSVLTVLRALHTDMALLPPGEIVRRVLGSFLDLEPGERTAMRLARMLANHYTLAHEGVGVVLLPPGAGRDEATWQRFANPMPDVSESAVQLLRDAVLARTSLPDRDAAASVAAARVALAAGRYLQAREHAVRALVIQAADPESRGASEPLAEALQLYRRARTGVRTQEREFLAGGTPWGLFVELGGSAIQGFLPQNTLLEVGNATGFDFDVGVRLRVLRQLDVMLSYGLMTHRFENDDTGIRQIDTRVQPLLLELAYRPLVLSYLKPSLRAGVGMLPLRARIFAGDGTTELERATDVGFGAVFGFGIDAYSWKPQKLRATVGVRFLIADFTFDPGSVPGWQTHLPPGNEVTLEDGEYRLDMDAWRLALTLVRDF